MDVDLDKLVPLGDNVLVKRTEAGEKSPAGLYIPKGAQEKPNIGTVVSSGPGLEKDGKLVPTGVSTGDEILFGKWSGTDLGDDHLVIKASDILGKMAK